MGAVVDFAFANILGYKVLNLFRLVEKTSSVGISSKNTRWPKLKSGPSNPVVIYLLEATEQTLHIEPKKKIITKVKYYQNLKSSPF